MKKIISIVLAAILMMFTVNSVAENEFLIVTPTGAPSIAIAGIYTEHPEVIRTIGADEIGHYFGNQEADMIIAPINAGAKLFKAGNSTYRLAAVITWGNLVFASRLENFTPDMINGRKLVLFGENTINSSIALYLLEKKGIVPGEVDYKIGASDTQALLMNEEESETIVMTAEPAITAAKMNAQKQDIVISSIALNDLYKELTGYDGFPQAGVFVKEKTSAENPEPISGWLEKIRAAAELCQNDPESVAKTVVAMEIVKAEPVVLKSLPGCSIRFLYASEAKEQIEFVAEIDLKQFGGEIPADDFYYEAKQ